jgi:hypothetical protein
MTTILVYNLPSLLRCSTSINLARQHSRAFQPTSSTFLELQISENSHPSNRSKKFPISIQHAERILFSNSRELLIYCASGFEKESWCTSLRHAATLHLPGQPFVLKMREDYASFIDLVRQLAGGGDDWLASDPHEKEAGGNSSIGKWRAKLRRKSKGRFASWGSAEEAAGGVPSPSGRPSSPPRKGESDTEDSAKKEGPESGSRSGGHSKVRSLLSGRRLTFGRKKAVSDVGERSQGSSIGGGSVLSEDDMSDAGGPLSGDEFSAGEESGRKSFVGDALTPGLGEGNALLTSPPPNLDAQCLIIRLGIRHCRSTQLGFLPK